jgi:hypothetical protein
VPGRADAATLERFMRDLGPAARVETRVYLTGGACAVLLGWRPSTIDADIHVVPESDAVFSAIPRLKEDLGLNVELASPADFVPELPGWRERSPFVAREGRVSFHHYDLYAQALAKIERGHVQDRADVAHMLAAGLVEPARLRALFDEVEPDLIRYPAVDGAGLRRAVEAVAGGGRPEP